MLPSRIYSIWIYRDWRDLYEVIWRPDVFPKWATGLSESDLREEDGKWLADGPEGPITIRLTPHNDNGVMDHVVDTGDGNEVHVPLRVIQNGAGAEGIHPAAPALS